MVETQKDGGPAHPCPVVDVEGDVSGVERGMSLRDWFAGQALAMGKGVWAAGGDADNIAANCYEIADAMLKEREES